MCCTPISVLLCSMDTPWALHSILFNNIPIKFVQSYTDLGITIDISLRFHQNIHSIVNKAGGLATNLLKATERDPPSL